MASFGEAFRAARVANKVTLREIGVYVNKSIGYLSEIEHGRKRPPDLDTVSGIEEFLGIKDGRLMALARMGRKDISKRIMARPQLQALLLRADDLDDEGLDNLIRKLDKEGE